MAYTRMVRKLKKLYEQYQGLKKSRLKVNDCYRAKERVFTADVDELFDISHQDAFQLIKNEEDKEFLKRQMECPEEASLGKGNITLMKKEERAMQWAKSFEKSKEIEKQRQEFQNATVQSVDSASEGEEREDENDDYIPSTSTLKRQEKKKSRGEKRMGRFEIAKKNSSF